MSENTINILETTADVLIVVFSGWAARLFFQAYRRSRELRAGMLTVVFSFVALFKLVQLVLETAFDLPAFAWMDTNLATEVLVVIFAVANVFIVSGGMSWRGRLSKKPGLSGPQRKDKAA